MHKENHIGKADKPESNSLLRKDFLTFGKPQIGEEEINEVVDSLRSGWISTGPKVEKFQELFRKYIGAKYALALNSCTAALHLCMLSSGIGPGDEVITSPMTFAATANTIIHAGAKPIFVDCEKDTLNINPGLIEGKITEKTKAILPVHFAGRPCDMDEIMALAKKHDLLVIEDAAHAIEASFRDKKIGTIGDATCFSFYVTKNLTTGEGGMVTTNNAQLAEKVRIYGLHGMSKGAWMRYSDKGFKHYSIIHPGYKYSMMDIQAAIGIHQLKRLEQNLGIREKIWKRYNEAFKDLPVFIPQEPPSYVRHARHLYTLLMDLDKLDTDRDTIQNELYKQNIGTGVHYISLHLHKYYKERFNFKREDFPNAAFISERTISLPLSGGLSERDVDDVINAVRKVLLLHKK